MNVFAIGDLHLSSQGKTMEIFGPQWKNHQKRLFENWQATVGPDDLVLVVGDLSWALKLGEAMADIHWLSKLPGFKVISKGNHDYWWSTRGKVNSVLPEGMVALHANAWMRDGLAVVGTRGWNLPGSSHFAENDERIYSRELNRLRIALDQVFHVENHRVVAMLHFPPLTRAIPVSGFVELLESYKVNLCVYAHLHGADHRIAFEGKKNGVAYLLVSCDYLDFRPIKLEL